MQSSQDSSTLASTRSSRIWGVIFFIALAVRLLNVAFLPTAPEALLREDAPLYWSGAEILLEQGSFLYRADDTLLPQTERVPGYFLFLAAIRAIFDDSLLAVLIAQSVVDSITCVLIAAMSALLSSRIVLPVGILAAIWPNLIVHSSAILSDTLFLMLFTAMLAAGCRFLKCGSPRWAALAGLTLGLSILTRPVVQLLPFLMIPAAFAMPLWHRQGVGAAILAGVLFLVGAIAPLSPLLYRNYDQFDAVALTSQSGTHLIGWVAPLVRRAADGSAREVGAADLNVEAKTRAAAIGKNLGEVNPFERNRLFTELGLEAIARYPISAIAKAWSGGAFINLAAPAVAIDTRVRRLPHPSFDETKGDGVLDQAFNFLSGSAGSYLLIMSSGILLSILFLGLQGYGFGLLTRTAPWAALFAALCVGYFLVVNGPVGSPKYRLPFEPILIVLSALAMVDIADRFRRRK
jgi:hypothetical protein